MKLSVFQCCVVVSACLLLTVLSEARHLEVYRRSNTECPERTGNCRSTPNPEFWLISTQVNKLDGCQTEVCYTINIDCNHHCTTTFFGDTNLNCCKDISHISFPVPDDDTCFVDVNNHYEMVAATASEPKYAKWDNGQAKNTEATYCLRFNGDIDVVPGTAAVKIKAGTSDVPFIGVPVPASTGCRPCEDDKSNECDILPGGGTTVAVTSTVQQETERECWTKKCYSVTVGCTADCNGCAGMDYIDIPILVDYLDGNDDTNLLNAATVSSDGYLRYGPQASGTTQEYCVIQNGKVSYILASAPASAGGDPLSAALDLPSAHENCPRDPCCAHWKISDFIKTLPTSFDPLSGLSVDGYYTVRNFKAKVTSAWSWSRTDGVCNPVEFSNLNTQVSISFHLENTNSYDCTGTAVMDFRLMGLIEPFGAYLHSSSGVIQGDSLNMVCTCIPNPVLNSECSFETPLVFTTPTSESSEHHRQVYEYLKFAKGERIAWAVKDALFQKMNINERSVLEASCNV